MYALSYFAPNTYPFEPSLKGSGMENAPHFRAATTALAVQSALKKGKLNANSLAVTGKNGIYPK
jgi:hypothetical protein